MNPRRTISLLLAAVLLVATSGCLGTFVEAPSRSTESYAVLHLHLLAAPSVIRADPCKDGLAEANSFVPLWGLAVGILTLGIVVPEWTIYSCAVR